MGTTPAGHGSDLPTSLGMLNNDLKSRSVNDFAAAGFGAKQ
jgi:hypothetical protein